MYFFIFSFFATWIGLTLAHPNPDWAQVNDGPGLYGCTNPSWSGGCAYFPAQGGNCQNVRIQTQEGGWTNQLHAVGPSQGTKCYVFAGVDCTSPFYPMHTTPTPDWSFGYPGVGETVDAVRSFKCMSA